MSFHSWAVGIGYLARFILVLYDCYVVVAEHSCVAHFPDPYGGRTYIDFCRMYVIPMGSSHLYLLLLYLKPMDTPGRCGWDWDTW